jgi:serine/threonine-protein kinase
VRATSFEASARFATARELADAVEQFLSGDRDLATRRELSARHTAAAAELARAALGPQGTLDERTRALEHLGRAIALHPNDAKALELLRDLLREPPAKRPPEVDRELEAAYVETRRVGLRRAMLFYGLLGPAIFLPAWFFMGLKSMLLAVLCVGAFAVSGAAAYVTQRKGSLSRRFPIVTFGVGIALAITAYCFGPFVLAPTLAVANTMAHVVIGRREHRRAVVAIGALALLVPLALELAGVVPPSFAYRDGALVATSPLVTFRETFTTPFFVIINLGLVVFGSLGIGRYRDALARGEERTIMQAWLLARLVPEPVREVAGSPTPPKNN